MSQPSEKKKPSPEPSGIDELKTRLDRLENKVYAAKIAYLNRTPFEGQELSYEALTAIAKEYIEVSYALQRAKFGSVKVKISVAKLLR
ncbi:MAG: hypothetical protein LAO76_27440 [Acidobacteriia bacterium]|nr:hypothetical protein [Terriglobia bacterium]